MEQLTTNHVIPATSPSQPMIVNEKQPIPILNNQMVKNCEESKEQLVKNNIMPDLSQRQVTPVNVNKQLLSLEELRPGNALKQVECRNALQNPTHYTAPGNSNQPSMPSKEQMEEWGSLKSEWKSMLRDGSAEKLVKSVIKWKLQLSRNRQYGRFQVKRQISQLDCKGLLSTLASQNGVCITHIHNHSQSCSDKATLSIFYG